MSKKTIVVIIGIVAIILLIASTQLTIKSVTVNSVNQELEGANLEELLVGKAYILYTSSKVESLVMGTGFVESVECKKVFPSGVELSVVWKEPVVAVKTANNYALLARDGYVISISGEYKGYDVVKGVVVKSAIVGKPVVTSDDELTIGAVNLLLVMKDNVGVFSGGEVYPNIQIKDDMIFQVISDKYWINFGSADNLQNKLKKAAAIYNFNADKGVKTGIINVSIENHEVYQVWK